MVKLMPKVYLVFTRSDATGLTPGEFWYAFTSKEVAEAFVAQHAYEGKESWMEVRTTWLLNTLPEGD